jgi:hypothetical protein
LEKSEGKITKLKKERAKSPLDLGVGVEMPKPL